MNNISHMTITINGPKGSGKTLLLQLLIDMMADAGLFTTLETKRATENPRSHFNSSRVMNTEFGEAVCLMMDKESIVSAGLALQDYHQGTAKAARPFEGVSGKVELDPALLQVMDTKAAMMREFSKIIDTVTEAGLPLLPLQLEFAAFNIPKP